MVSIVETLWSDETFRIFQYDRTTKPTEELVLQRVHPEDADLVKQTLERASQDGKDFDYECRLVMPDASVKYVHVMAHALSDESGGIEFVGAVMDVSDRKRAEEELLRSEALAEQRLRLVVDTTPAMINSCRPDGHLDYVNKGWLDYFGFSLETALDRADVMKMSVPSKTDMYGGDWQPIIHPEDLQGFRDQWKATLASSKPGEHEARVRRFDGVYRWHLFRAVPLYDETGKPVKWYASAFDIEDRKRAEEALRRSEGYLANAQRLTSTGSWPWNVATRQSVYWSQENYRLLGFDPEGGIPSDEVFYQRIHPEDRDRVRRETILERLDEGAHFDVDFRIVLPGGAIKYVRSTGHPVRNISGDLLEYVGTSIDVTERKRADEERERLLASERAAFDEAVAAQQRFRDLVNSVEGIVWEADVPSFQFLFISKQAERILGYPVESWLSEPTFWTDHLHPDDRQWAVRFCESAVADKRDHDFEYRMVAADGRVVWVRDLVTVVVQGDRANQLRGVMVDITDRKQAEEERHAHLRFLESMDRINRAIQGTNDLEQMMSDVLDEVLSIFDCDRAWLAYPCDPEAPSWQVPMEHTRPEFPGAFALGRDMPMDPEIVELFRAMNASSAPVQFGPGSGHRLPAGVAKQFSIQSQMAMGIHPKTDKPYVFGLHQCSYPRVWTPQEERLFQEIGRRLADALTSLLMLRNLREGEARLEEAQRIAHVGHWERYLEADDITWSDETYRIFGLAPQERAIDFAGLQQFSHPDDRQTMIAAVAETLRGG